MKILKHKFKGYENLVFSEGELKTEIIPETTLNFSLMHNGHKLFEQEYGCSIVSAMTIRGSKVDEIEASRVMLNSKYVQALASATYIDISEKGFTNDEFSIIKFKELQIYNKIINDMDFIMKLTELVTNSMPSENKNKKVTNEKDDTKKKK